jgi:hypothetical protein
MIWLIALADDLVAGSNFKAMQVLDQRGDLGLVGEDCQQLILQGGLCRHIGLRAHDDLLFTPLDAAIHIREQAQALRLLGEVADAGGEVADVQRDLMGGVLRSLIESMLGCIRYAPIDGRLQLQSGARWTNL